MSRTRGPVAAILWLYVQILDHALSGNNPLERWMAQLDMAPAAPPGDCSRYVLGLYRKRSGRQFRALPASSFRRSVSDTALVLSVKWAGTVRCRGERKADSGCRSTSGCVIRELDLVASTGWIVSGCAVIRE